MNYSMLESMRLSLVRPSNRKVNVLRGGKNEGKKHYSLKCKICAELTENRHNWITEAIFVNGGRADIVDLTSGKIYEIVNTEKKESIAKKKEVYPKEFDIYVIEV